MIEATKVVIGLSIILSTGIQNRKRQDVVRDIMNGLVAEGITETLILEGEGIELRAAPQLVHGQIAKWIVKLWYIDKERRGGWQFTYYPKSGRVTE